MPIGRLKLAINGGELRGEVSNVIVEDSIAPLLKKATIDGFGKLDQSNSVESDAKDFGIRLYPNPVVSLLMVTAHEEILAVRVYDLTGTLIKSVVSRGENKLTINLDELKQGLYLVETMTEKGSRAQPIIKQ